MRDIYREVTEQIIAELKNGVRPWVQAWSKTPGLNIPCNAVTGHAYRGVNLLLLWTTRLKGWPQPRFLSYRQALEAGGHVRKGEHGKHIVYVGSAIDKNSKDEDDPRTFQFLKHFTVFNIAQCDGLPDTLTVPPKAPNPDRRDALIDEFIKATGAKIREDDSGDHAYYNETADLIVTPAFKLFRGQAEYAVVLFHELTHWTGVSSRLNRQLADRFGSKVAAAEELIAELGGAFLCAEFSIDGSVSHATYMKDYLELLRTTPKQSLPRPRRRRQRSISCGRKS